MFLISPCGPDFNTYFEPLPLNAQPDYIFPKEINAKDKIKIDAIPAPKKIVTDDYFKVVRFPIQKQRIFKTLRDQMDFKQPQEILEMSRGEYKSLLTIAIKCY